MHLSITWTITAIIAVSSFLSPIAVAVINNHHQAKMRALELEHDERVRQLDSYYSCKKEAFADFVNAAGRYHFGLGYDALYKTLCSSINNALLYCNEGNQRLLRDFQEYIDDCIFNKLNVPKNHLEYNEKLNAISLSMNQELESTKRVIESPYRKGN